MQIIEFPLILRIGIGVNYAVQSFKFTFGLHLLLTSMTLRLATSKTQAIYSYRHDSDRLLALYFLECNATS